MSGWRKIDKPQPGEYATHASCVPRTHSRRRPHPDSPAAHRAKCCAGSYRSLPEERLLYRYATGKWTMKEVLLHLIDDERIYAYRALAIARGDTTPLPGFNQEAYALASRANERPVENLLDEYALVRRATLALFQQFYG